MVKKVSKRKKMSIVLILFVGVLAMDAVTPVITHNTNDARFLGIGTKSHYTPCFMGQKVKVSTFTIFGIPVKRWTSDPEPCHD